MGTRLLLLPLSRSVGSVPSCVCVVERQITKLPTAHKERTFSFDANIESFNQTLVSPSILSDSTI